MALHSDIRGAKGFYRGGLCMKRNILELIVMNKHTPTIETRIILRTILNAGALAMLVFPNVERHHAQMIDVQDYGAIMAT